MRNQSRYTETFTEPQVLFSMILEKVTESGFPVNYVVSAASVHDIHMVKTLAQTSPFPQIIGDKGYLSKDLKNELAEDGITLTTPMRKKYGRSR